MLKTRVIPTLLWKEVGLVKGIGFDSWRRVGPAVPAIRVYNMRDVDELVLLDISATPNQVRPDFENVAEFSTHCSVPLTVGGGITSLEDITALLRAGADKVALNTSIFSNPGLVRQAANQFGSQCVVASLDIGADGYCYSQCGTKREGRTAVEAAREVENLGAGEILLTSIPRDGTMEGYDLENIRTVSSTVNIPVIASGGAGRLEHFVEAVKHGAAAVAAASLYHFTQTTPAEVKSFLRQAGIPARV